MIQVIYEVQETWPQEGALTLRVPTMEIKICITPAVAQRRAKGYFTAEVAIAFRPGEPVLVWGKRPAWRMPVFPHLRGCGQVGYLGTIYVDALTGEVTPLACEQIAAMQERAEELAAHFTPTPAIGN